MVEIINTAYQVYNKSTAKSIFPATQVSTLFVGMPGLCGQGVTFFFSDPVVLYDKMAGHWLISIIAYDNSGTEGNECVAISTSDDVTGTYYRYAFKFGANRFNDYPKFGVWPDAYYASYNLFTSTNAFGTACAYDRAICSQAGRPPQCASTN